MNTIARMLSIFVLTVAALMIGETTTFASSNHDIPLIGMTHMPVNWTGDFGSGDYGDFNPAQYGGVQPYHHHSSTNMIADTGDNSNSTAGSDDFNSAQYGWSHPHHSSIIADYNGDNSNSTAGSHDSGGATQNGSSDTVLHLEPLRVPGLTVRP
jgi:hypothetical protein